MVGGSDKTIHLHMSKAHVPSQYFAIEKKTLIPAQNQLNKTLKLSTDQKIE
jgi:hypothetical protein